MVFRLKWRKRLFRKRSWFLYEFVRKFYSIKLKLAPRCRELNSARTNYLRFSLTVFVFLKFPLLVLFFINAQEQIITFSKPYTRLLTTDVWGDISKKEDNSSERNLILPILVQFQLNRVTFADDFVSEPGTFPLS